jgi:electron transfer flavoprotein alpha/beta subunit
MIHLVVVRAVPDLENLSVSLGQGRVFEKGRRLVHPADEPAVEAALQARQPGDEVVALVMGEERDLDALKKPLAMGADRGAFVAAPDDGFVQANLALAAAARLGAGRIHAGPGELAARLGVPPPGPLVPRTPNALSIMKAAKKPVERLEIALPEDDAKPRLQVRGEYLA